MTRKLIVDNMVCCGCLSCMINCAQHHDGHASPESARIEVDLEPFSGTHGIIHCQQCQPADCQDSCPQGAIELSDDGDYYVVDPELCIDCHMCVDACPHGAMRVNPFTDRVIKCDLCEGDPVCVRSCFTGALWVGPPGEGPPDKRVSRYFHLERQGDKRGEES